MMHLDVNLYLFGLFGIFMPLNYFIVPLSYRIFIHSHFKCDLLHTDFSPLTFQILKIFYSYFLLYVYMFYLHAYLYPAYMPVVNGA